ncbi:pentapeptide repeat protein [Thalassoporum mexicanum PCC 7367]|uniref:pentapeptide repeat-containing protein n=1 Tax=Thalassoporum mexicanum TaxID=3457544 RepID=UPI00029F8482|nr:pentapeptide repeat-containing protein [Pseudanabaena sp. PCC 7367]AFY70549.1 pentapeptide repeat protein [Pseudanabaena sp. PCC 7367]
MPEPEKPENKKKESWQSKLWSQCEKQFKEHVIKTQWQRIICSIIFAAISIVAFYYFEKWLLPFTNKPNPKYTSVLDLIDLDSLRTLSLISGIWLYILESNERKKRRHYEAWQVIDNAKWIGTSYARRKALEDLYSDGISFNAIELPYAELSCLQVPNSEFNEANFTDAKLEYANFNNSYCKYANFSFASLVDAEFIDAHLCEAKFIEADLTYAKLNNAILFGADFMGATLKCTQLEGAALAANFSDANLVAANLRGVNLSLVNLSNADLSEADLTDVRVSKANTVLKGVKNLEDAINVPDAFWELWKEQNSTEATDDDNDRPEENTPQ